MYALLKVCIRVVCLSLSLSPISILPISVSFLSQTSNNFDHRYFKVSRYLFRFYLVEWVNYLIWQWFISIGEKMRERFILHISLFGFIFPSFFLLFPLLLLLLLFFHSHSRQQSRSHRGHRATRCRES